jgi:hypothetical protein
MPTIHRGCHLLARPTWAAPRLALLGLMALPVLPAGAQKPGAEAMRVRSELPATSRNSHPSVGRGIP